LVICCKEWPSSKNLQAIGAGEGVERREPSYTDGIADWPSHNGGQYGGSWKKKKHLKISNQKKKKHSQGAYIKIISLTRN